MLGIVRNVNELLQAMDVMVMPSQFEGMPFALLEAQAAGLKCVVSDTVSRESDVLGWNVFLPLQLDDEAWANCILSIDLDYDRTEGERGVRNAGYDINMCIEEITNIIERGINTDLGAGH